MLGKDAHADFVKRRLAQGIQGLPFQFLALMDPGITGGAERMIGRGVGVTQIERPDDLHRSVVVSRRRTGGERTALAVQPYTGFGLSITFENITLSQSAVLHSQRLELLAHRAGVEFVSRVMLETLPEPVDAVITTSAGYPLDLTFYQSLKGITAAQHIVKPGGKILLDMAAS